jgi:hypothetical protein
MQALAGAQEELAKAGAVRSCSFRDGFYDIS